MCVPGDSKEALNGFVRQVEVCLARYRAQNGQPALDADELGDLALALWQAVSREWAATPLAAREPGELSAGAVEVLVKEIGAEGGAACVRTDLEVPLRQLLKACLQREPLRCRDSYREVIGGACRRQELGKASGRISGSHCVDCPHWLALDADENRRLLENAWVADSTADLRDNPGVFLPEDFRVLRRLACRLGGA